MTDPLRMATVLEPSINPDSVVSFAIEPGTLPLLLKSRREGGPRLICHDRHATFVAPGRSHESFGHRIDHLILAICSELGIVFEALGSTTWTLPAHLDDTGYEADEADFIPSCDRDLMPTVPDLAVEVVVSHPAEKALRAAASLGIPEVWVLDLVRQRLTFYWLVARGPKRGTYRASRVSRAFPFLTAPEFMDRLNDSAPDSASFDRNCRSWAREVLARRRDAQG